MITRIALSAILLATTVSPLAFPSKSLSQVDRQTTAQESCLAAARKSGAIVSAPQGVDAVCGTSLLLNPASQPVLGATEDGAELPPPECVEELERSDFCLGDTWVPEVQ